MGRLDQRVALVTGGGDGIGRGVARGFTTAGANVLVPDMDETAARLRGVRIDRRACSRSTRRWKGAVAGTNPMRHVGDPETDTGPVAAFVVSEDVRYVTGNTLFVDGGGTSTACNGSPILAGKRREEYWQSTATLVTVCRKQTYGQGDESD